MATARSPWMSVSTGFGTVVFTAFFYGIAQGNYTETRFTGAFHGGYGGHGFYYKGDMDTTRDA